MESSKLLHLSQIAKCGGYIKADLELSIWLLEKCNTCDSKKELGLLYLDGKYDVCLDKIVDILSVNYYYCKFILALIYFNYKKYDKVFNILNYENVIDDYRKIQDRDKFDKLLLYMGLYELDKNLKKGKNYFIKMDGVLYFLMYLYGDEKIENAINNGDLYSCYISDKIENKEKFINNFDENFYIDYFTEKLGFYYELDKVPTNIYLLECFNKCLVEIAIYSIKNNTFKKLDSRIKLHKYKCESIEDKYNIALIAFYAKLENSNKYYTYMYTAYDQNYLDARYYLALMYYYGYGTNKNNEICYELLSKCDLINSSKDIFYYLIKSSNNKNINIIFNKYYKLNHKFNFNKKQILELYQNMYINNIDIVLLLKNESNNFDLFFNLIVNNYKQKKINKIYIKVIDYFLLLNFSDNDKLDEIYYIISIIYLYGYINNSIKINKNTQKGLNILKKSVNLNNIDAINEYVYILINSEIEEKNYEKVYELLDKRENNWVYAYFLYNGIIEKQNKNKALEILQNLNDSFSLLYFGIYTENFLHIKKACELKNRFAILYMIKYYELKNNNEFIKYIKLALDNNILDAYFYLTKHSNIIKKSELEYNEIFWKD